MAKESKKIKRVIGISFILLAGITGFYQWRYSKVQDDSKESVLVATKQIDIGDELTEDNTKMEGREKKSLSDGNIVNKEKYQGSVATEVIFEKESVNKNRIVSKEEYEKKDLVLVSIKCTNDINDALVGYDVKPGDKVDLLYYTKSGVYEGHPYVEDQVIYNLKSNDGVSYENRKDGFKPSYALIWIEKDKAEEINSRQESGGYFKCILHRNRGTEEEKK